MSLVTSSILWRRLDRAGHEAARLSSRDGQWLLDGSAVFQHEEQPCRLEYAIICDSAWNTTSVRVDGSVGPRDVSVVIEVDVKRQWTMNGVRVEQVSNCLDVDLNFSPSTNLLPIRRLALAVGDQAMVRAAWLCFPGFELEPLEQIYRRESAEIYGYESAGGRFKTRIDVNGDGFVTRYPDFWQAEVSYAADR